MNEQQKEKVIELRKEGLGYKRIANNIDGANKYNVRDFIKTKSFKDNHPELVNLDNYKPVDYSNVEKNYGKDICEHCGREYTKKAGHQKYCCDECRHNSNYEYNNNVYDKVCKCCEENFKTKHSNQKYCSDECRNNYHNMGYTRRKNCGYCGEEFESHHGKKFCSEECYKKHRKKYKSNRYDVVCDWCGKDFKGSHKEQRFCSTDCQYEWQNKSDEYQVVNDSLKVKNRPELIKRFKNKFEEKFPSFEYHSEYTGADDSFKTKCKICGHIQERSAQCIRPSREKEITCNSCGNGSSGGEHRILHYLKDNNYDFKKEYMFSDLLSPKDYPLRFDFAVRFKNKIVLVEYQGKQHYEPVSYFYKDEKEFEYRKKLDKIKESYCKKNNIKLIKIPYWKFDSIEKILNKELSEAS